MFNSCALIALFTCLALCDISESASRPDTTANDPVARIGEETLIRAGHLRFNYRKVVKPKCMNRTVPGGYFGLSGLGAMASDGCDRSRRMADRIAATGKANVRLYLL